MRRLFNNDNDFSEVIKKGISALLIRVLGFVSGYFFIFLIVKDFGAETQGRLSLSFSFMILGALLCRFGLDIHFVKVFSIPNNFDNAKGIYFKLIPLITFTSLCLSGLIFYFSDFISEYFFKDLGLSGYLKWTSPCIFLYTFILINSSVFRGLKKNNLYSFLFNGGRFVFALILLVVIFLFYKAPIVPVIAHTLAIAILFLISVYYIVKLLFPVEKKTLYSQKEFIIQSLPMLLSTTMIVFLGWSDTIILGIYDNSATVGIYSVLLKIAAVASFTFQAIDSILAPKLSQTFHSDDMKGFKRLIKYSTGLNLIVSILVVFGLILLREFILNFFGEEFKIASTALIILCVGQLFNAICGPVGSILQMTGNQKVFQNILLISLAINIILNLLLVKPYGINGVSIATALSLSFWNLVSYFYIKRNILIN